MAKKPEFMPIPRGWTQEQTAARLGISLSHFCAKGEQLKRAGFPQPDPLTGRTDGNAVDMWMSKRSPILAEKPEKPQKSSLASDRVKERLSGATHDEQALSR